MEDKYLCAELVFNSVKDYDVLSSLLSHEDI